MDANKTHRIANLKHEVNDLHPVLKVLLKRLPGISNVEYTQGPTEMGADFVLTKKDETLGGEEYIGCIVKVGQIKQDHSEIIRQIDECGIKRTIEGGKKEIYLTELWVISTGNITAGAQRKIHDKFNNKNIKFISGERLTILIDNHYPEFWRDVTVEVGEYLRRIEQVAAELSGAGNSINAGNGVDYIPQTLQPIITKRKLNIETQKSKRISITEAISRNTYILIEAQMGTGKSTLLAQTAKIYTNSENFNFENTLPILLSSKELMTKYNSDASRAISEAIDASGVEDCQSCVLLIDALDELKIGADKRLEFLIDIYNSTKHLSNIKVVITTRNIDNPEHEADIEKTFSRFRLCSLTIKQVVSLVGSYCKDRKITEKLSKDISKSNLFRKLPKTPISAILLAKLLNENIQEIPSTMTELYEKYMELVIGRWDMDKGLQSQREYDVLLNVIINASGMIMENSLLELPIGDLKSIFNEYVDDRNLSIDKENIFRALIHKSEIFSINERNQTIRFRHRTFTEFFYAKGLNRDSTAKIDENVYDLYWSTSYFFYLGLRRDCPEILGSLNEITFSDSKYELLKLFNHGALLLAAYLTPYRIIEESVANSFQEAARLYDNLVSIKINSPLTKLSNIQLLCVFTKLLCDNYSYEYFIPALKSRAQDLFTTPNADDRDFAELFFIDSVLMTIDDAAAYDKLIQNYGKLIPISIQAGIMEHSRDESKESPIVKKFVKNFKKNIKTNTNLHQLLIEMYNSTSEDLANKLQEKRESSEPLGK
jgi:hypothetical protein